MQITAVATGFEGLTLLQPKVFRDLRGSFVKSFHEELFRQQGLQFTPREEFYTTSDRGVLRGMHFQRPPAAHSKLVYCTCGRVLDVVLNLRRGSPQRCPPNQGKATKLQLCARPQTDSTLT